MSDTVYCYHCRRYHPAEEMTRVTSKGVTRWRCVKSLVSARNSQDQRDAFGKHVSAQNRAYRPPTLPHCVRELFGYASQGFAGVA